MDRIARRIGVSLAATALVALGVIGCSAAGRTAGAPAGAAPPPTVDPAVAGTAFAKPGFTTLVEGGRLWVLGPGEAISEKCVTLVGAGPQGMTIKALDRKTALAYLLTRPGFTTEIDEDERVWVFRSDEKPERSEKHVTRVAPGPLGAPVTLKALTAETLDSYEAAEG